MSELLEKDTSWAWGPMQTQAFKRIKQLVTTAPTLQFFNTERKTVVSSDVSSYGLGAVLMQEYEQGRLQPVAYASGSLTPTERRYSQIEKECLGIVWACERFDKYLTGLAHFTAVTDHKPLLPIVNKKDIPEAPTRCQRMLIRLMRFNFTLEYTKGINLTVADALSRSPVNSTSIDTVQQQLEEDIETHLGSGRSSWPASDKFLNKIRDKTSSDVQLSYVIKYVQEGWPEFKQDVKLAAGNFFPIRGELSCLENILLKGNQIVVPFELREEVLEKIHASHLGVTKCKERARQAVWWPRIASDICEKVSTCHECIEKCLSQRSEPLMPTEIQDRPYQKVGSDLFEIKGQFFIVIIDYYTKNIDIERLTNPSTNSVIKALKRCFSTRGVPMTLETDNAQCNKSHEFSNFAT
ncbi:Pol polyprotein [Elysia marginata]|uniref:Pol polyprotein n=1 Tax=Elysia marginata TaxID=1093978 RepID=A0AAV4HDJ4_9GAST|nr:Pol polyprotein [Elysia marginata]